MPTSTKETVIQGVRADGTPSSQYVRIWEENDNITRIRWLCGGEYLWYRHELRAEFERFEATQVLPDVLFSSTALSGSEARLNAGQSHEELYYAHMGENGLTAAASIYGSTADDTVSVPFEEFRAAILKHTKKKR